MPYRFKYGDRPLDGLTIQRAVGRGGFGEVYYALADSGKQVALKYLRENPEVELRGVAHVMNLKSPHLITIYDVKQDAAGESFVLMEYVSGPSLRDLMIAEPRGLDVQKAAFFTCGIAKGLAYLHDRGIVHRDLKPGNIFYDDGYVKIGDYGLSKFMAVSQHSGQTISVGTVHYMAPEIGSGSYTKAIDIYALGVILFEMLTGRLPFSGSSMGEVLMRHLSEKPDTTGLPEPFASVIAKALAKDPKDRYQDANEMADALMSSGVVSESIASFNPASLTNIPRAAERPDPDRTMTTPPRPPPLPPLDARDPEINDRLGERAQRRMERLGRKFEQRLTRWERKLGPRQQPRTGGAGFLQPGRTHRIVTCMIIGGIALALSVALAAVGGRTGRAPAMTLTLMMFISGSVVAGLFAHLVCLPRVLLDSTLLRRAVYVGLAAILLLPAAGIASDAIGHDFEHMIAAPLAMMAICDWGRLIETGRRGRINGGDAFWPAMIGLVVTSMVDVDTPNALWVGAAVCGAIALLTQAGASLWPPPLDDRLRPAPAGDGGGPGGWDAQAAREERYETPVARRADEYRGNEPSPRAAGEGALPPLPAPPPPIPSPQGAQATATLEAEPAAPSFAGRGTGASVFSVMAKFVVLAGMALPLFYTAIPRVSSFDIWHYPNMSWTGVTIERAYVQNGQSFGKLAPQIVMVPFVLGSLLLLISRLGSGWRHLLRGLVGCGVGFFGLVLALGPGQAPLELLMNMQRWGVVLTSPGLLITTGILAAAIGLSLLLLLWPQTPRQRTFNL